MGSLRELIVSIDFDNVDMGILDRIERDVDDIEDALEEMGNEIDEVMAEFAEIASVGSAAFDEISSEAHSAASAIDEIGDEAQGAAAGLAAMAAVGDGMLDGVESQADQTARALDEIGDQAGEASAALVAVGATGSASMRELERAAQSAAREVDDVGDEAQTSALKIGLIATALVSLTAVGSAAIAPLVAGILALSASLGAAGIGMAAFGAVSVSILGQVFEKADEVAKLEEKIADADTAKEKLAAQKELAEVYEKMGENHRDAVKDLQAFKGFWKDFTKQFEEPVFAMFSQGLKLVQGILKEMAPTISNVSDVLLDLMGEATNAIEAGGLKPFFEWLSVNAAEALNSFAHIFGNVFAGVFSLLQAFTPLGASMEEGLLRLTERFKAWAASVGESNGFKGFIEYVKTNGPVLMELLGNLVNFIVDVGVALAPLGEKLLGLINNFANFLATSEGVQGFFQMLSDIGISIIDNWGPISDILISLAAGVAAFKIAMVGMEVIGIINGLMMAWRAGTLMQTIAMMGLNAAMWANPITWIIAAIAALIAIGVLLYLNWDTVKAKALELWANLTTAWSNLKSDTEAKWNEISNKVKTAIDDAKAKVVSKAQEIWQGLVDKWNSAKQSTQETWDSIKTAIGNAMDTAKTAVSNFFSPLFNFIDRAKGAWDGFVGAIKSFKMPSFKFPSLPSWMPGGGADGSHATGLAQVPFDGYKAILHKDEAVLTARQSNALREAGILGTTGSRPTLNLEKDSPSRGNGGSGGGNSSGNTFAPQVVIHVNSNGDASIAQQVKEETKKALREIWDELNLAT
ncbi:TPA: hypothetical protein QC443_002543 [Bacillus cereus]|uniref:hypothetical protein n=1 Tax=Bacillus cereus TaxID=1396 RepID=UPI00192828AC|nr:hypothetical protein [Bacillus cereus]MBL3881138.1 hypothetical protein [Bacillus cereus]HDR7980266.1 hypothetical protein [Bacillus cereus]HDR8076494.1 hypothetical protein [Bacillus cereus]HDR8514843.1 hypothetical protein [Bacillus cereus]